MSPLIFLLKLAWESRYRLPLLITVVFMAFDVRMQLDIDVSLRRIPRRNRMALRGQNQSNNEIDSESDSWVTEEEEEYTLSSSSDDILSIPGTSRANNNLQGLSKTIPHEKISEEITDNISETLNCLNSELNKIEQ